MLLLLELGLGVFLYNLHNFLYDSLFFSRILTFAVVYIIIDTAPFIIRSTIIVAVAVCVTIAILAEIRRLIILLLHPFRLFLSRDIISELI